MEILSLFISIIVLAAIAFIFVKLNSLTAPKKDEGSMSMLQQQMENMRNQMATQINQITEQVQKLYQDNISNFQNIGNNLSQTLQTVDKNVNSRLDNAAKVISDVHRRLGEVHETTKQVQEVGKDIASLQEILRAPKLRGGLGELFLGDLLSQILPNDHYQLQYKFKSGEAVDAIIFLKNVMVPIDSKFPMENFKKALEAETEEQKLAAKKIFVRDVKKHITSIADKYILPDEGTFNFALMYIPAENVYYETIIKDENLGEDKSIFQHAISKRVLPVSPNSFYAYLQTILLGLRGMSVEEKAQEILKNLEKLGGDFKKVGDDFSKMGTHLKNLNLSYESTDKRLSKFGNKLESLEESQAPLELPQG